MPKVLLAADLSIADVRRNIPLSDTEPVYKDFYINSGEDAGFKKHQIITVVRKISVQDSRGSQTIGDMNIPVGQLKIIAVYPKVSVAREYKLFSRDDLPMLEQFGLMIGDLIELKSPVTEAAVRPEKKYEKSADIQSTDPI